MSVQRKPDIRPEDALEIVRTSTSFLKEVETCGKKFDVELETVYSSILAHPLERFICNCFVNRYPNLIHDGKPGRYDLFFESLNYELEVKTTQTLKFLHADVSTWDKNQKKNIIYFVRKQGTLDEWVVVLFEGITRDMFGKNGNVSKSARGKATMKKWKAWKHARVLLGDVTQTIKRYKTRPKVRLCFSPKYKQVKV